MAIGIHGRHRYSHKTIQRRNQTTTQTKAQTVNPLSTWKARRTRPIPQTRKMQILETRNRVLGSYRWKWGPQNEPKKVGKHQKLGDTQESNGNTKIPRIHRILPVLCPKLLTNRTAIASSNKENNPLGMDKNATTGLRPPESTNVWSTSPNPA